MPAKDIYHNAVKSALLKDGWTITADPYRIVYEDAQLYGDNCSMEKLNHYRDLIKKILTEYYEWASNTPRDGIEECLAFDEVREHYFWFHIGWDGKHRVQGVMVYLRIRDGKIWVEEDWTKQGVVNDLLEAGVPHEDIVLGFQHPSKRPLTEFAIA